MYAGSEQTKGKRRRYGIVDYEIMNDPSLSLEARAIYSILASYANKDRSCHPTVKTLLQVTGVSKDRFYKHMNQLIDRGIVEKYKMAGEYGRNPNLMTGVIYVLKDDT